MRFSKKSLIVAIIVSALIMITFLLIIKYNSENRMRDSNEIRQEKVVTDLGDKFILTFESRTFPDDDTAITIMDSEGKEQIAYIVVDGQLYKSQFISLLNSKQIRCYQFHSELIYSINNKFKSINLQIIDEVNPNEQPDFVDVAKALVEKKEWKWIKVFSRFLLKSGDIDFVNLVKRYAIGQFNEEEISKNKDSEISRDEIQSFCIELLKQK